MLEKHQNMYRRHTPGPGLGTTSLQCYLKNTMQNPGQKNGVHLTGDVPLKIPVIDPPPAEESCSFCKGGEDSLKEKTKECGIINIALPGEVQSKVLS